MENFFNSFSMDALIGITGTLAGTVFGWWLGRTGKILIRFKDISVKFSVNDRSPEENIEGVQVQFDIWVYNRKAIPCSLTDCNVRLQYQDECVVVEEGIFNSGNICELEQLSNVGAFTTLELHYNCNYDMLPHSEKLLANGYKIYLEYRLNGKRRIHKKTIRKSKEV